MRTMVQVYRAFLLLGRTAILPQRKPTTGLLHSHLLLGATQRHTPVPSLPPTPDSTAYPALHRTTRRQKQTTMNPSPFRNYVPRIPAYPAKQATAAASPHPNSSHHHYHLFNGLTPPPPPPIRHSPNPTPKKPCPSAPARRPSASAPL